MRAAETPRDSAPRKASVAVLIVTWNGWEDAAECIDSVLRSQSEDVRVYVCDNDSADGTLDRLRDWASGLVPDPFDPRDRAPGAAERRKIAHVRIGQDDVERPGVIPEDTRLILIQTGQNLGFAGANNVGLRAILAEPDIRHVWLLNPDTVIDPGSLDAMLSMSEADDTIGIVGSKILFYDRPDVIQAIGGGKVIRWQGMTRFLGRDERDVGQWEDPLEPDYITGCSMLVRAEMIRDVGLMDESYFLYSEEVDWCIRARRAGWRLVYCPASRVWHKEGRAAAKSELTEYYSVRNYLLLTRKFEPTLVPVAFLYSLYRCALPKVVRLQGGRLKAVFRAYREFFTSARAEGEAGPAGAASPRERPGRSV